MICPRIWTSSPKRVVVRQQTLRWLTRLELVPPASFKRAYIYHVAGALAILLLERV